MSWISTGREPFTTVVPFWELTSQIPSGLSPKRDCGSKRVNAKNNTSITHTYMAINATTVPRPHTRPHTHNTVRMSLQSYKASPVPVCRFFFFFMCVRCPYSTVLSTRRHPAQPVPVPILQSQKRYKFCGHEPTPQKYYVATYAVSTAVVNAMPCHHIIYDGHDIHHLCKRETKRNNQREDKNKVDKSKGKKKKKK